MLFFRSEEHVDLWCASHQLPKGGVLPLELAWKLAQAWYRDKLDATYTRPSVEETEVLFAKLGLSGEFWRLR